MRHANSDAPFIRERDQDTHAVEIVLPKYDCMRYDQIWGLHVTRQDLWVPWFNYHIHCTVYFGQVHGRKCFFIDPHQKMAALYSFITSQQCADIFASLDTQAEALLEIQVKEKKAHDAVWKQQGILIRSSQKVHAELRKQIDAIIGTASAPEVMP